MIAVSGIVKKEFEHNCNQLLRLILVTRYSSLLSLIYFQILAYLIFSFS